ncbi:MAG: CaiB/BaiF CoA-transferase family protein [Chloroflexota bacterium]
MTYQPLTGIRVLDLTRLLPGPYLTMLLSDLGAEVIKIETPRLGDYARIAPPEMGLGGLYDTINQGKKSLALNYRNPRGQEILLELARHADVIMEGFRPGVVKSRNIDYDTVKAVNPGIIYCSLSGYGQDGPYRHRAGHDLNYIAVGSALDLNGVADGPPIPPGVPIADLSGGMLAAIAILAALVGRQRTGRGAYLDIALLDGVISWVAPLAGGEYFSTGKNPERGRMPLAGGLPCFNVYPTRDGKYISLGALEPHFWSNFCQHIERHDLIPRQLDPTIRKELEAVFQQRSRDEWLDFFSEVDTCLEPVNTFEEMLSHPQVRYRGFVQEEGGKPVGIDSPFAFAPRRKTPAPALGQHTSEILEELNYEKAEIDELEQKGVIKLA